MAEARVLSAKKDRPYSVHLLEHIVYAHRESRELEMRILTSERTLQLPAARSSFTRDDMHPLFGGFGPVAATADYPREKHPVLVYAPGSGFMGVSGLRELLVFTELVRRGFIVAEIDYRGARLDNARFPDAVVDCKEAIRFLRANAEKYNIDPDRIAVGGNSSGGWTAMMTAATCGESEYETGENLEFSSSVSAVLDCYGPMDFEHMIEDRLAIGRRVGSIPEEAYSLFRNDVVEKRELLGLGSVVSHISTDKYMPPSFIVHGSEDTTVPYRQSERVYERLISTGKVSALIKVEGAGHGMYFWSPELINAIYDFLKTNI